MSEDRNIHTHGGAGKDIRFDLSVNINPLGMPKGCMEAAVKALETADRYPDTCHEELIGELSRKSGGHQVILGNGSCELIYALCHHMGHKCPGYSAYTIAPTFTEYGYAVLASGGREHVFTTGEEDDFALGGRMDELKDIICSGPADGGAVKLVFICNPNNPTGELIERDSLESIADALDMTCPGTVLAVDECFLRFSGRYEEITMTKVLDKHRNVLVLDAFTKFYAMPGLRLGYAISADKDLLYGIKEGIQPWNVSDISCAAALAAIRDKDYERRSVEYMEELRGLMAGELRKQSLRIIGDPAGPYIMVEGPADLKDRLNRAGIDIRDCSDMMRYHKTDRHYYRIAVGKEWKALGFSGSI